ncbi:sigma-70 family RNA polymerase sigma factor [Prosthecobacter sp.]|uniref:sigma-70 family RNA polymerase sigma factor n=1 Tax=Prosthecobacter sp. TaxID=1965333 RepID=UPI0037832D60
MADPAPSSSSFHIQATYAGAGDAGAFEDLLAQHTSALKLYVRSLLPGQASAEDVAQETLIKLWEKRSQFIPGTHFKAWAFQIAKFLVMNQRRKLARSNEVLLDDEVIDRIDQRWQQQGEPLITDEHHEALGMCMKALKQEDRDLLHARYATETSLETYAGKTGIPPGTLKARLFRLRDALRACIERRLLKP